MAIPLLISFLFRRWKCVVKTTKPALDFAVYWCYGRQFCWIWLRIHKYVSVYDMDTHIVCYVVLCFSPSSICGCCCSPLSC